MKIKCSICGVEFNAFPSEIKRGKKCCSLKCHAKRMSIEKSGANSPLFIDGGTVDSKCQFCGIEFKASKKGVKNGYGKFCSHSCAFKNHYKNKQNEKHPFWKGGMKKRVYQYRDKNPVKVAAWTKVAWHIRTGKIKKLPCERCGSIKSHAHHDDYSKPLEIRWLCAKCHTVHHRKIKPWGPFNERIK